jgi:uncharacterized protein
MKCPNCEATLLMTERQGVEIDYCPQCRGVWLDKGELDKIIEKSMEQENSGKQQQNKQWKEDADNDDDDFAPQKDKYPQQRRKGGFLSNFFDFD